jgi:hypothetical protein
VGACDFKIGDILYDTLSKDIGILIGRFDNGAVMREHDFYLWVWEIYWTQELHQFYSEDGLKNMVTSERLIHFGSL